MTRLQCLKLWVEDLVSRTARAKVLILTVDRVIFVDNMRNALILCLTVIGLARIGTSLGGAVLTSTIFSLALVSENGL